MAEIKSVYAREVLDSRWNPTVEVELTLADWSFGRAIVPSWASTWVHEALELRDWDKSRYLGKGTLTAVKNVNTDIKAAIEWKSFANYRELDKLLIDLDWTKNRVNLVQMLFCE